MAMRGVDFKWYDGFFLSMLATSVIIVAINWKRYHLCVHPLHIWIVVDYTTVFIFRLLMFVDNGLAAGMGLDLGWQQRYCRFCGRIVVLSVLILLLYPFLWVWTVIGTLWFLSAKTCLPEEGQKWGFLIWLAFSYCGLVCIACMAAGKWLTRRQSHLQHAQQGIPISEYGAKSSFGDQNVLSIFVVGGINSLEVREAMEALSESSRPDMEFLLGDTTLLTPDDMFELLLGSSSYM